MNREPYFTYMGDGVCRFMGILDGEAVWIQDNSLNKYTPTAIGLGVEYVHSVSTFRIPVADVVEALANLAGCPQDKP